MSKLLKIALGIVTSIGGFLDVGAVATAAQAGSNYRFRLLWAIVLGPIAQSNWQFVTHSTQCRERAWP